jgi:hypothetical protein
LAKQLQWRRFFRNQPIRNKNCLWRPCLLTDWDEMSNLYRGPSKFRFIWQCSFRGDDFRLLSSSQSVSKHGRHRQFLFLIGYFLKNLLLWNCLAKWIERPSDGKSSQCLWQGELKTESYKTNDDKFVVLWKFERKDLAISW